MMNTHFSRCHRLLRKEDFRAVFTEARKVSRHAVMSLYLANHLPVARLGIIIPKQKVKLASTRNSFKRIVRESFRVNKDRLKGLDLIVLLRREWCPVDRKLFRKQIDQLWQSIPLVKS